MTKQEQIDDLILQVAGLRREVESLRRAGIPYYPYYPYYFRPQYPVYPIPTYPYYYNGITTYGNITSGGGSVTTNAVD